MKIYKKKILVGICGLGNGHNVRQTNIITKLLKKGHQIVLFVTTDNEKQISTTFPSLKKIIVKIPWVFCGKNGVDFRKTKDKYLVDGFDWYRESLSAFIKVDEEFKGKPDLVMTDYEPNSAQYSYARNIPLICLEQQSKFIGHPFEDIDKFSPNEEMSRLLYFFPKAKKRYVSSFFPLLNMANDYNVESIPPIISSVTKVKIIPQKVVVYFSPYGKKEKNYIKILNVLKSFKDYNFFIYSDELFEGYKKFNNLVFKKIGRDFQNDIKECDFIISTAGHQLISEAIGMQKPLLLSPLGTFEQNYNAKMVENYKLGKKFDDITVREISMFISNVDYYRKNMKVFKKKYWKHSWDYVFMKKLEKDFNL